MMKEKLTGEVIWFSAKKGYGFISWSKNENAQKDLFVHFSDISQDGFKNLLAGQKVMFELGLNNHDIPKAINVQIV